MPVTEVAIVTADANDLAEALDRGARLRRSGIAFDVDLRFPDDRSTVANLGARDIVRGQPDARKRGVALDALALYDAKLGPAMLEDLSTIGIPQREAARDALALARAAYLTSRSVGSRLTMGLDYPLYGALHEPRDATIPMPTGFELGDRIVLWAPTLRTEDMILALAGATLDGAPVDVVCAGGDTFGYDVRVVDISQAANVLANAGVIVAIDAADCRAAVALAAWQRPLCSPRTSGASGWLRDLTTYAQWSRRDLALAIGIARGRPIPRATILEPLPPEPEDVFVRHGPPVTLIVQTDTGVAGEVTTQAIARIDYAPLDVVIVTGPAEARAAERASNAEYLLSIEDGDALYPESIARFVDALERSGEDSVRANALVTYLIDGPGPAMVYGHAVLGPHAFEDVADQTPMRTMIRRESRAQAAPHPLTVRIDATIGTVHRFIDGRSPFLHAAPPRPTRLPALRLLPPRPLVD